MSTDLAVIEAALKAATPAPWRADNNDVWTADGDRFISAPVRIADANLIANAPTWLAELVERVKVAEAEAMNNGQDYDRRGERLWRLAAKAGWTPSDADNDAIAEMCIDGALKRAKAAEAAIERVRAVVADHPGSAWDSGIKLRADILRALDGDGSDEVTRFTSANSTLPAVAPTPPFCERCGGRSAEGV